MILKLLIFNIIILDILMAFGDETGMEISIIVSDSLKMRRWITEVVFNGEIRNTKDGVNN